MPHFTDAQLAELQKVAKAARRGPWSVHVDDLDDEVFEVRPLARPGMPAGWEPVPLAQCADYPKANKANATHIATFDPAAALKLLADLTEAREALRPLADIAKERCADAREWDDHNTVSAIVTIAELRAARAALGEKPDD